MNFTLKVWRQKKGSEPGHFETVDAKEIPGEASFLEMLDIINERLQVDGTPPIHFDSDCREGICGQCSLTINGLAHGPEQGTTTCQLRMWSFEDGSTITVEPFRAKPFPVIRDLVVNRQALDRIIQSGGYVSVSTGSAIDANAIAIPKNQSDAAMDAAACIGCGACVAACPNASAMLFTGAKVTHLARLPQGKAERNRRVLNMVHQMDEEGFGNCSNHYECEAVCPADIKRDVMSTMNREYLVARAKELVGAA